MTITIAHGSPAGAADSARSRRRAAARAVASPARTDQVARPDLRPGRALRRHRAASLARHPGRLGAARQSVGAGRGDRRLLRRAQLRLEDLSRPQGDDREDPRPGRPLHALDLAAGPPRELRLARLPRRLADGRRQDRRPGPHDAEVRDDFDPPAAAARRARRRRLQGRPRRRGQPRVEHARRGTGATVQNLFPLLYDRAAAAAFAPTHGKQFATLFRSAVPGSSSVLPGFVGPDAEHSFNGLRGRSARRRRRASPACPSGDPTSAATPAGS